MRFEKLPGLPPYGPMARAFGGPNHSEGLIIRFYPLAGDLIMIKLALDRVNVGPDIKLCRGL